MSGNSDLMDTTILVIWVSEMNVMEAEKIIVHINTSDSNEIPTPIMISTLEVELKHVMALKLL